MQNQDIVTPGQKRVAVVRGLLEELLGATPGLPVGRLLDVGSGRIGPDYAYADLARAVTCVDWNPRIIQPVPAHVEIRPGDFLAMEIPQAAYDAVICADVFEHVGLEDEAAFAAKCAGALRPGGVMVVSVPHAGRYAWLDPFEIKPALHRGLARFGLYSRTHNGFCDIRKGHKHYARDEIARAFAPLAPALTRTWGHFWDPVLSWADALQRKLGVAPGRAAIARACDGEYRRDWGDRAFNIAVAFRKPGA